MSKFKVGDVVKRIFGVAHSDSTWIRYNENAGIDNFGNFTVIKCGSSDMTVEGLSNNWWTPDYFKLVEENTKFKVGDVVKIIDSGQYYSTCSSIAVKMNLKNWESMRTNLNSGATGKIIAMCKTMGYDYNGTWRYAIEVNGKDYVYNSKGFITISTKEKLVDVNMDIEDIKNFPAEVLATAEKEAKEELAKDQAEIAKTKFKELFVKISEAERDVKMAQKRLSELRGKIPTKKTRGRPKNKKK